ncbi:MAG: glycosyltransferase [Gemmataceae bacterium]|nr:glycosyltransferase [Gemmataceae bacterium]
MRIVHLVSSLGPTCSARYLAHVVPRFPGESLIINTGFAEPFAPQLRQAGTSVRELRFRGPLDGATALDLYRSVAAYAPDIVHFWGDRATAIANVLVPHPLRRPSLPIVVGDLRADSRSLFVCRMRRLACAARDSVPVVDPEPAAPAETGLPAGARMILNVGGYDERSDQRSAVWSYDMLRYVDPQAHLVVVGDGPLRAKVEAFAKSIGRGDPRIHFVGPRADVPALLRSAAIAFSTHRAGGRTFLAEALAAGVPVVAVDTPDARTLIRDGENGLLVRRGDYPVQAGAMLRIVSDSALANRLTEGARESRFPTPDEAARDLERFYRTLAG